MATAAVHIIFLLKLLCGQLPVSHPCNEYCHHSLVATSTMANQDESMILSASASASTSLALSAPLAVAGCTDLPAQLSSNSNKRRLLAALSRRCLNVGCPSHVDSERDPTSAVPRGFCSRECAAVDHSPSAPLLERQLPALGAKSKEALLRRNEEKLGAGGGTSILGACTRNGNGSMTTTVRMNTGSPAADAALATLTHAALRYPDLIQEVSEIVGHDTTGRTVPLLSALSTVIMMAASRAPLEVLTNRLQSEAKAHTAAYVAEALKKAAATAATTASATTPSSLTETEEGDELVTTSVAHNGNDSDGGTSEPESSGGAQKQRQTPDHPDRLLKLLARTLRTLRADYDALTKLQSKASSIDSNLRVELAKLKQQAAKARRQLALNLSVPLVARFDKYAARMRTVFDGLSTKYIALSAWNQSQFADHTPKIRLGVSDAARMVRLRLSEANQWHDWAIDKLSSLNLELEAVLSAMHSKPTSDSAAVSAAVNDGGDELGAMEGATDGEADVTEIGAESSAFSSSTLLFSLDNLSLRSTSTLSGSDGSTSTITSSGVSSSPASTAAARARPRQSAAAQRGAAGGRAPSARLAVHSGGSSVPYALSPDIAVQVAAFFGRARELRQRLRVAEAARNAAAPGTPHWQALSTAAAAAAVECRDMFPQSGVQVQVQDALSLCGYVHDHLIDAALHIMAARARAAGRWPGGVVLPSAFFAMLKATVADVERTGRAAVAGDVDVVGVQQFTSHFSDGRHLLRDIVMALILPGHWIGTKINMTVRTLTLLDSLGRHENHNDVLRIMFLWIEQQLIKHGKPFVRSEWHVERGPLHHPLQTDSFTCGLFSIMNFYYIMWLGREATSADFTQSNINDVRRFITALLLNPQQHLPLSAELEFSLSAAPSVIVLDNDDDDEVLECDAGGAIRISARVDKAIRESVPEAHRRTRYMKDSGEIVEID